MRVELNKRLAKKILDTIIQQYRDESRPPDGKTHVSEIVFPRQAFGLAMFPEKREASPLEVGFFFLGKSCHSELQRILGIEDAEVEGEKHGIVGTMDYKAKRAYEIKTSRKWTIPDSPNAHYIRQAGYYSIIHDLTTVDIVVIYPTAGRSWKGKKASTVEVRVWSVTFSPTDKKHITYDMLRSQEELKKAIKKKNLSKLPPCPDWLVEKFEGEIDPGDYNEKEDKAHPFWYAYNEKGWL